MDILAQDRVQYQEYAFQEIHTWLERCRICPDEWQVLWRTLRYTRSDRLRKGLWISPPAKLGSSASPIINQDSPASAHSSVTYVDTLRQHTEDLTFMLPPEGPVRRQTGNAPLLEQQDFNRRRGRCPATTPSRMDRGKSSLKPKSYQRANSEARVRKRPARVKRRTGKQGARPVTRSQYRLQQ